MRSETTDLGTILVTANYDLAIQAINVKIRVRKKDSSELNWCVVVRDSEVVDRSVKLVLYYKLQDIGFDRISHDLQ